MTIGEPKHPVPPFVAEIVAAHAAEFGRYPPNDGAPELRAAIAGWLAPPLRRHRRPRDPAHRPQRQPRGAVQRRPRALARDQGAAPARRCWCRTPSTRPTAPGALAAGAELVPVPATADDRLPARLRRAAAGAPRPRDPRLPLLAVEPAGRGRRRRLPRAPARARRAPRLPRPRRRVLQRDLPRHAAARRARRRRGGRRRPRAGARLQLALQALERPRPALRLRRRRAADDRGAAPAPRLRRRAAAAAAAARGGRALAGRGARRGEPRALRREVRRSPTACSPASPATPRREGGFFLWLRVGDGEAAALRLWRETGVRVLPGGYLGRATAEAPNPGADYIRVALVADAAAVERGLAAIRDTLGASISKERV